MSFNTNRCHLTPCCLQLTLVEVQDLPNLCICFLLGGKHRVPFLPQKLPTAAAAAAAAMLTADQAADSKTTNLQTLMLDDNPVGS
jgi:hypothetical protein